MKTIHFFKISILIVVIVSTNCTKEAPATGTSSGTGTINPPPPPINTPPTANRVDPANKRLVDAGPAPAAVAYA